MSGQHRHVAPVSRPIAHRALLVTAVSIALLLAVPIVRIGIADTLAPRAPHAALGWWPQHTTARLTVARELTESTTAADRTQAMRLASDVLQHAPLEGGAYTVLARIAEHAKQPEQAERLYRLATRYAPRDRYAHLWLADTLAGRGEFDAALAHFDQLLRIAPGSHAQLFPSIGSLAADPTARTALLQALAQAPPWRERFLAWFAQHPETASLLSALFGPLRTGPYPLQANERAQWQERLLRDGEFTAAWFVWVDSLAPERRQTIGNVYNGSFEFPASNTGFDWRIGRIPGATVRQEVTDGAEGNQALMIDFHNRRVPFAHVQQRLALAPGHYRLTGRSRAENLRTERGLQWSLRCASGNAIAASQLFASNTPWQRFALDFEIPADCRGQTLHLRLAARNPPEQWIGGRIWFDAMQIEQQSAGHAQAP